jgi:2-polyprenyl-6-methoxyphenol hydroxylase-like FAD-dependent oxidoreductase
MSAWANVYRPLKDRFPAGRYRFGKGFTGLVQTGERVSAFFDDGTTATGDLLIGADGLRSTVRAQLMPIVEPQYAGYVAWRSIVEESLVPAASREWLGEGYWFVLPKGEMFLCYQVPAKQSDKNRARIGRDWNYVWYRPVTEAQLADFCTDAAGKCHGTGIAPPLIRPDVTAYIKREGHELLPPHLATLIDVSQPFFQAIFDIESPRLVVGRTVLLGDAAFVARPHVGMGVTKGALDALCLSNSLKKTQTLDTALARYDRLRSEFGRRCVARARRLGSYIEARSRPEKGWSAEELDQRPERLLHEVALALADIPELQLEI